MDSTQIRWGLSRGLIGGWCLASEQNEDVPPPQKDSHAAVALLVAVPYRHLEAKPVGIAATMFRSYQPDSHSPSPCVA